MLCITMHYAFGGDNAVSSYARRISADGFGALTRGCICSALCYVERSERTLKRG